jgi:hypothetical protein
MSETSIVDIQVLREQVREKYRAVADEPDATYHFHTGRPLAARLGYDPNVVDALPEIGPPVDTFGGAAGEANARTFDVHGDAFLARKPQPSSGTTKT